MSNAQSIPAAPKSRRVRPGLYETVSADGQVWTVEEREVDAAWGGGFEWFAVNTEDRFDAMDPMPRKADCLRALAVSVS